MRNPQMRGGPFIHYDETRVNDVKALMERIRKNQAHLFKLCEDILTLEEILTKEANGLSLETIYQKVPNTLRGYVELIYDAKNRPSIRFIEGLLYKSSYYDEGSQGVVLSLINSDNRPFVLSSPRLLGDGDVYVSRGFRTNGYDELFKMKGMPQPLDWLKEMLDLKDYSDRELEFLFTDQAPEVKPDYKDSDIRIRYFGHACVLIESGNISILCDPLVSYQYEKSTGRHTYVDLPRKLDYVLITHSHQDHFVLETLLQLRHKIGKIILPKNNPGSLLDPSLKLILRNIGFRDVVEVNELESVEIEGGLIISVPFLGEHGDLDVRSKTAYLVQIRGRSVLLAADSNNLEPELYGHIQKLFGDIDLLFLGMECKGAPFTWLYGPLISKPLPRKMDQSRRLNGSDCLRAVELVRRVRPKAVYIYAMGQEPWMSHLTSTYYTEESLPIIESNKLVDQCKLRGTFAERLFITKECYLRGRL